MVCTALSIMQYIGSPLYILENNVGRISKINTKKDTAKRESWRSHFVPLKLSVVNIAWNLLYYNHFLIDTLDILFEKKKKTLIVTWDAAAAQRILMLHMAWVAVHLSFSIRHPRVVCWSPEYSSITWRKNISNFVYEVLWMSTNI